MPKIIIDARHQTLQPKERLDAEASIRSSLIQLLGGGVLVAGLYFTARGFRVTRVGHITDRFAKSIEQLGSESLDVRIGGVFSLERIARDSSRDRETVVEVLTAFVREHTREGIRTPSRKEVTAYVQSALKVVGRRPGVGEEAHRLNLYHCGLKDADLMGADLRGAMLYYSRLVDAHFADARLAGTGLSFCYAERAAFSHASAPGAEVVNAVYKNGWFLAADLKDADFYGCDLSGSDFGRRYAEKGDPPLPPATLTNVRMTRATLTGTNLQGVDLSSVRGLTPEQLAEAITDETLYRRPFGVVARIEANSSRSLRCSVEAKRMRIRR